MKRRKFTIKRNNATRNISRGTRSTLREVIGTNDLRGYHSIKGGKSMIPSKKIRTM